MKPTDLDIELFKSIFINIPDHVDKWEDMKDRILMRYLFWPLVVFSFGYMVFQLVRYLLNA